MRHSPLLTHAQCQAVERIVRLGSLYYSGLAAGCRIKPRLWPLMVGPTGSGKSFLAREAAHLLDAAYKRISYVFARLGAGAVAATDPLFPSRFRGMRLTRWGANAIVHAVLAKAGLEGNGDYGTHTLRKTFCRQIYKRTQNDLNLTRAVMGHSSCATTQKYLHVDEEEMVQAVMPLAAPAVAPLTNQAQA